MPDEQQNPDGRLLASLAMLSVQWNELSQSYLDNFVPFVLEAVLVENAGAASDAEATDSLLRRFGFDLPPAVVHAVLKRAQRANCGRFVDRVFRVDRSSVDSRVVDLKQARDRSLREQSALVDRLMKHARVEHEVEWSTSDAETHLQAYVSSRGAELLRYVLRGAPPAAPPHQAEAAYIIADFISMLCASDPVGFEWLEAMVKGSMLSASLYLPVSTELQRQFRQTTVWLDTPIILQWLGYEGSAAERSAASVVDLISSQGAHLAVFQHTVREARGVILGAAEALRGVTSYTKPGGVLLWMRQTSHTASDALLIADALESELARRNVLLSDVPDRNPRYEIDENVCQRT